MLSTLSRRLVYVAVFLLPLTFLRLFSNFSASDAFFMLAFVLIYLAKGTPYFIGQRVILKNEFMFPLFIFTLGFLLSVNRSTDALESSTAFLQIVFIFMVVFPVLQETIKTQDQVKTLMVLLIIPSILISLLMVGLKIVGLDLGVDLLAYEGWRGRLTYGGMEPNIPGRIMLQTVPFLVIFALISKSVTIKVGALSFMVTQLVAILLTSSRSNFVTFLLGLMLFVIFLYAAGERIKLKHLLFLGMVGALILIVFYSYNADFFTKPMERYGTILDAQRSASSQERLRMIDKGFTYLNGNPVLGLGLGSSYLYTGVSIHNPIILTWVENGFLGTMGFSGLYLVLMYFAYQAYKHRFFGDRLLIGLTITMIMMTFGDMFMANSYKRVLWVPALLAIVHLKNIVESRKA